MVEEMQSIEKNGTWEMIDLPNEKKQSTWNGCSKQNLHQMEAYKSIRLVL